MAAQLLLLFAFICSCSCSMLPSSVYEGSDLVAFEDKGKSPQRHLLLSVLLNLNKLLALRSDDTKEKTDSPLFEGLDSSVLENLLDDKIETSKRARSDVAGVLPPWNEFCRMMHITSCVHSRHR